MSNKTTAAERAAEFDAYKRENLTEYAAAQGYELDKRESSRNSAVMRHPNGDKIIIAKQGEHWIYFSVRDDADNGSIIDFVMRRQAGSYRNTLQILREWTSQPRPAISPTSYAPSLEPIRGPRPEIIDRFLNMPVIQNHPALTARGITPELLQLPRFARCVMMDERRNACFPHYDRQGVCGWEAKNKGFTGFAAGGKKGLWFSRAKADDRALVIAESAIDALSYAALFPDPEDRTRYFSTGGSLNPAQPDLIRSALAKIKPLPALMLETNRAIKEALQDPADHADQIAAALTKSRPPLLILATDNDEAGHALADQIRALAPEGLEIRRPLPKACKDWNDELQPKARPSARYAAIRAARRAEMPQEAP